MADDSQSKNSPKPTIVQRVAPYPIPVDIVKVEGQPPQKQNIVKMTEIGFLMKVDAKYFYKVGENIHLTFTLPVVQATVRCDGKIVKTYDAIESIIDLQPKKQVTKMYTVEVHFTKILEQERRAISNYLLKSGQKKNLI